MVNLQNPNIPTPVAGIEIDKAIYQLQLKLDTNLNWLSHSYGRAYRHMEKNKKFLYFPEIYIGGEKNSYFRVTPDNDKSGMCFFIVGKEENYDFDEFHQNYLKWKVGIVFNVNLSLINSLLLQNELFTQHLIRDVRNVLTMKMGGIGFTLKLINIEREFGEIYREFNLQEENEYLRSPMQAFRVNCEIILQEDCNNVSYNPCEALQKNLSKDEKICVLESIDFNDDDYISALSEEQKTYLLLKLQDNGDID